jgi:hypothetical protein
MCRLAWLYTGGKGLTLSVPALSGLIYTYLAEDSLKQ